MTRVASIFRTYALVGITMLALGFAGGWLTARLLPLDGDVAALVGSRLGANAVMPNELRDQFSIFWEAWTIVDNEFYHPTPLDHQRMIQGAIKGMFASLDDPYTVYQEPQLAALTSEHMKGTLEGIGVYYRITDGKAFIDRPIKHSPAFAAGLQQGDEIVAIDGTQVATLIGQIDQNEAVVKIASLIRGPKGSEVVLSLRRGTGTPFDLKLTREQIVISSVSGQMLDNGVAYIKITDFKATTTEDFDAAIRELLPQAPRSMVLDLRNNPGGYLTNAQEVLGRFYDGTALYEQDKAGELKALRTIKGAENTALFAQPLVVLVNEHSASASEIVAGALHDERAGTYLLGEKTFGKGSVQNIHALSDTGSARVTFAHWLTPHKTAIHKIGITPQYIVPYTEGADSTVPCMIDRQPAAGQSTCADSQLAWALKMLITGQKPPPVTAAAN